MRNRVINFRVGIPRQYSGIDLVDQELSSNPIVELLSRPEYFSYKQAYDEFGPFFINDVKTIAIVMNPWRKVVSCYKYLNSSNSSTVAEKMADEGKFLLNHNGFESFVDLIKNNQENILVKPQSELFQHEYKEVDAYLKFENMAQDASKITEFTAEAAEKLGNKFTLLGVHTADYQTYYNEQTQQIIGDLYAADCEKWGYQF